ncbi:hypothetical protein ABH973_005846 [Bradyrhizobium ottawaense]
MPMVGLKPPRLAGARRQLEKGRNSDVSALFDARVNHAVQITAQAVTGRFRCLTVVPAVLPMVSVIPAPE